MRKVISWFLQELKSWALAVLILATLLSIVFGGVSLCGKVMAVPKPEVTKAFHQMHPLLRTDGDIKVQPIRGYISEGPVPLDENFAMVRVQVRDQLSADYASEYGAVIALKEQPQVGDKVIMTIYEVYNNPLMKSTFVRIAKKEGK